MEVATPAAMNDAFCMRVDGWAQGDWERESCYVTSTFMHAHSELGAAPWVIESRTRLSLDPTASLVEWPEGFVLLHHARPWTEAKMPAPIKAIKAAQAA